VGLLSGSFPLSISNVRLLLDQRLGVEISRGALSDMRQRVSTALEAATSEAHQAAQTQPVAYVDETGAPQARRMVAIPRGSAAGCG
jgi:hypothetical protein